jgi:hypothetical protein
MQKVENGKITFANLAGVINSSEGKFLYNIL